MTVFTPEMIATDPNLLTRTLDWPPHGLILRLVRSGDAVLLGCYLESLSEATRQLYAPHAFDKATANRVCAELDYEQALPFVGEIRHNTGSQFAAYVILGLGLHENERRRYAARGQHLAPHLTCSLAPSVADQCQSQGLGSLMMPSILEIARNLGRRQMVLSGGTQARNARAVHFYEKFGFRRMGDFEVGDLNNHDMVLDLV